MKHLFHFLISALLFVLAFVSCQQKEAKQSKELNINTADYEAYLASQAVASENQKLEEKLLFWIKKYAAQPSQYVYLNKISAIHESKFALSKDIADLKQAEHLYEKALLAVDSNEVNTLHSLCRNYISQHQFKKCLPLLEKATEIGEKSTITNQILFDVHLELGNIAIAKAYLNQIKNPEDFHYLLRKSKWEDYNGNLEQAIAFLELAATIAEKQQNDYLLSWVYSNLGDYYGHAGEITKAYHSYLKTLKIDPTNIYVLKGIAWIQYSKFQNITEANRILDTLIQRSKQPDLLLFKAELAEFQKKFETQEKYLDDFMSLTSNKQYGVMYDTPKALYLADHNQTAQAVALAKKEVANRPTAMSYSLLSWCYFKNENYKDALSIIAENVANKTTEPDALLRNATIYQSQAVFPDKVKTYFEELKTARFELGPVTYANLLELGNGID